VAAAHAVSSGLGRDAQEELLSVGAVPAAARRGIKRAVMAVKQLVKTTIGRRASIDMDGNWRALFWRRGERVAANQIVFGRPAVNCGLWVRVSPVEPRNSSRNLSQNQLTTSRSTFLLRCTLWTIWSRTDPSRAEGRENLTGPSFSPAARVMVTFSSPPASSARP
jgi:hypothetical protein